MDSKITFEDWLIESPNTILDKDWHFLYIEKMYKNIHILENCIEVANRDWRWREYLSWFSSPFEEIYVDKEKMLRSFRSLLTNLDILKKDRKKYMAFFGGSFGQNFDVNFDKTMDLRVGASKTALDQYARFLCGVKSTLARRSDYIRNYYEQKIVDAKNHRISPLYLSDAGLNDHILSYDLLNIRSALNTIKMWRKHGIADVNVDKYGVYVNFGYSAGQKTKFKKLTIT